MCDALCVIGPDGLLFAKNSDRPPTEPQVFEAFDRRRRRWNRGHPVPRDPRSRRVLRSSGRGPHGSGVSNTASTSTVSPSATSRLWTTGRPRARPPALLGMDIVRLGLERGRIRRRGGRRDHRARRAVRPGRQRGARARRAVRLVVPGRRLPRRLDRRDLRPDMGGAAGRRGRVRVEPHRPGDGLDPSLDGPASRYRLPAVPRTPEYRRRSPTTGSPPPRRASRAAPRR